jgi:hypothetical protein
MAVLDIPDDIGAWSRARSLLRITIYHSVFEMSYAFDKFEADCKETINTYYRDHNTYYRDHRCYIISTVIIMAATWITSTTSRIKDYAVALITELDTPKQRMMQIIFEVGNSSGYSRQDRGRILMGGKQQNLHNAKKAAAIPGSLCGAIVELFDDETCQLNEVLIPISIGRRKECHKYLLGLGFMRVGAWRDVSGGNTAIDV